MSVELNQRTENHEYALKYAQLGLEVFLVHYANNGRCSCQKESCQHIAKHPMTQNGFKDATTDENQINEWWTKYPQANIGIRTGQASDLFVLDIDERNGGMESFENLIIQVPGLLNLEPVITGGNGLHYYFSLQKGWPTEKCVNGIKGFHGIDFKGEGGYVVAPPSIHQSSNPYSFSDEVKTLQRPHLPSELLPILHGAKNQTGGHQDLSAKIPEGKRNPTLFQLAQTWHYQSDNADKILNQLRSENQRRCVPPLADPELQEITKNVKKYSSASMPWDDPVTLPSLLPVPKFDLKNLPSPMAEWIQDVSDRMNVPLDYAAIASVVAIATVVGSRTYIRPKAFDDWSCVANIWGIVIGYPGQKKSHVIKEILSSIYQLEHEAHDDFKNQLDEKNREIEEIEREIESYGKPKKGEDKNALYQLKEKLHFSKSELESLKKSQKRFVVNDSSQEKLGEILAANPNGILLHRDEVSGLIASFDKNGHETDRAFFLESWLGNGSYTWDRIGRGTIHIPNVCISLLGSTQPDKFYSLLEHDVNDGFLSRLQLSTFPDEIDYKNVDRAPNNIARARFEKIIRILSLQDLNQFGARTFEGPSRPAFQFEDQAQKVFNEWMAKNAERIRNPEEQQRIKEHLSKYNSLVPSLALLFHLTISAHEATKGDVSVECVSMAVNWCDYLEAHARRIYGLHTSSGFEAAKKLLSKISSGELGDGFRVSQVCRKGWGLLKTPTEVNQACSILEKHYYLRKERSSPGPQGGRPSTDFIINPKILKKV